MFSSFFLSVLSLGRGSAASRGSLERKVAAAEASEFVDAPARAGARQSYEGVTGAAD
jgi:hypothetical protein